MSIFQTRKWWGTKVGDGEEFDAAHLLVGNITNDPSQQEKIVLGSYQGLLRIYQPTPGDYNIENLLYENHLKSPIIQIEMGQFNPLHHDLCLLVLFFKKFSTFQFTQNSLGVQSKMLYECNLSRNAYNMCSGKFGNVVNKDFICIQSCDGLLMVYEQDQFTCMCQINDFLIPSPIEYHPLNDSIIVQNSAFELEQYKIASINSAFNSQGEKAKLKSEWQVNIGEQALRLTKFTRNPKNVEVVAVTEQMIFIISQAGTIITSKLLDYTPCYLQINPYLKNKGNEDNKMFFVLSSFTHHLLVYEDFELRWATKIQDTAHALKIATFGGTPGMIVTLSDEGKLNVTFTRSVSFSH